MIPSFGHEFPKSLNDIIFLLLWCFLLCVNKYSEPNIEYKESSPLIQLERKPFILVSLDYK